MRGRTENSMKMYIMRHGETDWNKVFRLQGRSDIPLNETGRRMAENAAKGLRDVPFTRIYSSPLIRAYETASIVRGDRDIPIITDERIIEISFGANEGQKYDKTKPGDYPELAKFFREPDIYVPAEGGEAISELNARTADFIRFLADTYGNSDELILVTTHGAAIRGILSYVKGTAIRDFWKGGVQSNCGVTIMEVIDGSINIVSENVTF